MDPRLDPTKVESERRRRNITHLTVAMLLFVASRAAFFLAGVYFDASPLLFFHQFIDPHLLRTDLLVSVYWFHAQPPLFNLYVGLVLKAFGTHSIVAFAVSYLILGGTLTATLVLLMRRLGVDSLLATVLTVLFVASPASILYENWLFTTYPIAVLLALAALFVHRFATSGRTVDATIAFSAMAVVALMRPLYHLLWIAVSLVLLFAALPASRRRALLAGAVVPLALVLGLYARNAIAFGDFSASSWLGMNMARITTMNIPPSQRSQMVRSRELSPVAMIPPFSPLSDYLPLMTDTMHSPIPVLGDEVKSTSYPNFNNLNYLVISHAYFDDAIHVITTRPGVYVEGIGTAWLNYFIPASDYWFQNPNRRSIYWYDRIVNWASGQVVPRDDIARSGGFWHIAFSKLLACGLVLIVVITASIVFGIVESIRRWKSGSSDRAWISTVAWISFTILFASVVGNMLDTGENNRFRFELDPMILTLAALTITWLWHTFRPDRASVESRPEDGSGASFPT